MTDRLDEAIAHIEGEWLAAKGKAEELMRHAETLHVRLSALKEAAQLRPLQLEPQRSKVEVGNRGRQPGAISKTWRNILISTAFTYPDGASEDAITEIARKAGIMNVRLKDVRDRMNSYQDYHYVEPALDGWRVTQHALARFGSDQAENFSDQADDGAGPADAT